MSYITQIGIVALLAFFVFFEGSFSREIAVLILSLGTSGVSLLYFFLLKPKRSISLALRGIWTRRQPFYIIFFLLVVSAAISLLFSIQKFASIFELLRLISLFLLSMIAFNLAQQKKHLAIIWGLVLIGLLAVIPSLLSFFLTYGFDNTSARLIGSLQWYNHMANFILLTCPLVVTMTIAVNKGILKIGLLIASILMALGFLFTYSRAAWLAGGFGLFVLLMLLLVRNKISQPAIRKKGKKNWQRKDIFLFGGGFILLLVFFIFLPSRSSLWQRVSSIPSEFFAGSRTTSGKVRIEAYRVAWQIFQDYPWFGSGPATYGIIYGKYQSKPWLFSYDTHNILLQILAEQGIVGFLLFIIMIGLFIFTVLKKIELMLPLTMGLIYAVSTAFIHNLFDTSLIQVSLASIFWVEVGLILGLTFEFDNKSRINNKNRTLKIAGERIFAASTILLLIFLVIVSLFFTYHVVKYRQAINLGKDKQFDQAITITAGLARSYPYQDEYFKLLGSLNWLKGDKEAAAKYYQQAININPYSVVNYLRLAEVLASMKQDEQAEKVLTKAIEMKPYGNIKHYLALGQLYLRNEEASQAEKVLKLAIEDRFPVNRAYYDRRHMYQTAGVENQLAQAYQLLAESLKANGKDEEAAKVLKDAQTVFGN